MDDFGHIGLLCGFYQSSPPVESRSSALIIDFTTDDINCASGFNITYVIHQSMFAITEMIHVIRNLFPGFPTMFDTYQAVKMARNLKFWI